MRTQDKSDIRLLPVIIIIGIIDVFEMEHSVGSLKLEPREIIK